MPLRGRKGSKVEGDICTASFLYSGYVDRFIDDACDYDGLFYVADWFPMLPQMAHGEELLNENINADVVRGDFGDATDIDGLGLWPNMSQCGFRHAQAPAPADAQLQREWVVNARMCGDDEFFIETYTCTFSTKTKSSSSTTRPTATATTAARAAPASFGPASPASCSARRAPKCTNSSHSHTMSCSRRSATTR